jgi:surface polysaccharide O-acyltransferase-like enzyme
MTETLAKRTERDHGVDLLRMIAMYMVVVLHILGGGGVLGSTQALSVNYCVAWLIEIASYSAVNCYALISGYVGIRSKRKMVSIIMLWLQVALYSSLFTVLFGVINGDGISIKLVIKSLMPVTFKYYWYFTAYVCLWLFMPILNAAVEFMSPKQMGSILVLSMIVLIPVSVLTDAFSLQGGYSAGWLMYLYLCGAYCNKYHVLEKLSRTKWIFTYLLCVILTMAVKLCLVILRGTTGDLLVSYMSPTIILSAIALLGVFANLKMKQGMIKVVKVASPLAFGVYLIHNYPIVFDCYMRGRFSYLANEETIVLVASVFVIALIVYVACSFIEYVRGKLFSLLHIRELVAWMIGKANIVADKIWQIVGIK